MAHPWQFSAHVCHLLVLNGIPLFSLEKEKGILQSNKKKKTNKSVDSLTTVKVFFFLVCKGETSQPSVFSLSHKALLVDML